MKDIEDKPQTKINPYSRRGEITTTILAKVKYKYSVETKESSRKSMERKMREKHKNRGGRWMEREKNQRGSRV